jgi:hypothetical protein
MRQLSIYAACQQRGEATDVMLAASPQFDSSTYRPSSRRRRWAAVHSVAGPLAHKRVNRTHWRYGEVSVVAVNLGLGADRTAGANGLRASHFGNDRTSAGVPSMDTRPCCIAWARDIYPSQIR